MKYQLYQWIPIEQCGPKIKENPFIKKYLESKNLVKQLPDEQIGSVKSGYSRLLCDEYCYGIICYKDDTFLPLDSFIDSNTVFYNSEFTNEYMKIRDNGTKEEIESLIYSFMEDIEFVKIESEYPIDSNGKEIKTVIFYINKNHWEGHLRNRFLKQRDSGYPFGSTLMMGADIAVVKDSYPPKILKYRGLIENMLDEKYEIKKENSFKL